MVMPPHKDHQKIVLGARNVHDRYQKVVLKQDGNAVNIRFDNHPQPYVCATRTPGTSTEWVVTKEKWSGTDFTNDQYRWKVVVLAKRITKGGKWEQKSKYPLDWDHMKHHSLKVVFVNMEAKMVLASGPSGLYLENLIPGKSENLSKLVDKVFWEVECVDHNWSAGEVGIACGVIGAAILGAAAIAVTAGLALPAVVAVEGAEVAGGAGVIAAEGAVALAEAEGGAAVINVAEGVLLSEAAATAAFDQAAVFGVQVAEFVGIEGYHSAAAIYEMELHCIAVMMAGGL